MGRRNKKKYRQQQQLVEETPREQPVEETVAPELPVQEDVSPEPIAEEETIPEAPETVPEPEPLPEAEETDDEESSDETEDDETDIPIHDEEPEDVPDEPPKGFIGTYWMLLLGVLLATIGVAGVIMLRTNFIQVYIMGIDNPSPSIGTQEAMAYIGSIVPFVIGLFTINYWGSHAVIPEAGEVEAESEAAAEPEDEPVAELETGLEVPAEESADVAEPAERGEFGHEHLPPNHLTAVQKIKHLTMAYSQGKISEGLYTENMAMFEEELEARPAKVEPATEQDYGHEHLPAHHLSPEDKIDHLTKAYAQGKISKGLYERDLAKFEEELKKEQLHMPPHHLTPKEKIDHLEDAYRMGRISKGTYEKNIGTFTKELESERALEAERAPDSIEQPEEVIAPAEPVSPLDAEIPEPTPSEKASEDKTLMQLDSLLEEIESGNDTVEMREKLRKKKEESFEERILQEIEDLEDL